ncbi:MAG: sugar ABC transporter permease [Chloroflexi bacterium]|nr:sugar ABC transporter permease [Chloroflexota bacterium]
MRKANWLVLLALPAFILWAIFMVGPFIRGILMSFTNEALVGPNATNVHFVGLDNYHRLLTDPDFYNSVKVSSIFVFGSAIVGQVGLGLLLAVLINRKRKVHANVAWAIALTTAVVILAWVTPAAVIGLTWTSFLNKNGVLNQILSLFGHDVDYFWLAKQPMLSIILANIWQGTGWSMLLLGAAIESVPHEVDEAAEVDGATSWQRFRYVTLPLIMGPILVNLIFITIWTYGVFEVPFMLTKGGPAGKTELLTIYGYQQAFKYFELGYGSTVAMGVLVITMILAVIYYRLLGKQAWNT